MRLIDRGRKAGSHALERLGLGALHPANPAQHLKRMNRAVVEQQRRAAGGDFFFVQIGANDGVSYDDWYTTVTTHRLRGIVVEPIEEFFGELTANYAGQPQVRPVRAAIHATESTVDMYRVLEGTEMYEEGRKGHAALTMERHRKEGTDPGSIAVEHVPAMSWTGLLDRYDVTRIDYLQIDTEGYDAEILKMVAGAFGRCRPAIIKFEHCIYADIMSATQFGEVAALLTAAGYLIAMDSDDAVARLDVKASPTSL
jgi:FkbM family methyltransferase